MRQVKVISTDEMFDVPSGALLIDALVTQGIPMRVSCGGKGICGKCAVQVVEGHLPVTPADERFFTPVELSDGWRLACRAAVDSDIAIEIELPSKNEPVLFTHNDVFNHSTHSVTTFGLAVDIGTTTIAAALVDLDSANTLASAGSANPQTRRGDDVISRIEYSSKNPANLKELQELCAEAINGLVAKLVCSDGIGSQKISHITVGGNPAMQFLSAGIDCSTMAVIPFNPPRVDSFEMAAENLGIKNVAADCSVQFMPIISGYVGGDVVADILACGLREIRHNVLLIDVGTNGEMVLSAGGKLYATSTAAGPAFEGARISQGMRNTAGAICKVRVSDGKLVCKTVNDSPAIGICGTGLIDVVAGMLELGMIDETGRMEGDSVELDGKVRLTQRDIREVQLAKGAIQAGADILLKVAGIEVSQLEQVILAGAFGSYLDSASAVKIGLLSRGILPHQVTSAGNTALAGIRRCLLNHQQMQLAQTIAQDIQVVELGSNLDFQASFVESMMFE